MHMIHPCGDSLYLAASMDNNDVKSHPIGTHNMYTFHIFIFKS